MQFNNRVDCNEYSRKGAHKLTDVRLAKLSCKFEKFTVDFMRTKDLTTTLLCYQLPLHHTALRNIKKLEDALIGVVFLLSVEGFVISGMYWRHIGCKRKRKKADQPPSPVYSTYYHYERRPLLQVLELVCYVTTWGAHWVQGVLMRVVVFVVSHCNLLIICFTWLLRILFNLPKWLVGATVLPTTAEIYLRLAGVKVKPWTSIYTYT